MKWELKRNPALTALQQPKSRAPVREFVQARGSGPAAETLSVKSIEKNRIEKKFHRVIFLSNFPFFHPLTRYNRHLFFIRKSYIF
jgi:hypothetical protein